MKRAGACVRAARAEELDDVARLWHESALSMEGPPPEIPTCVELRLRIDCELANQWCLQVAVRNGAVIGILATRDAPPHVDQLFVAPAEQGARIGRLLLDAAKRKLVAGFTLWTGVGNLRARRFYEREGLICEGESIHPRTGLPIIDYRWIANTASFGANQA